MSKKIYITVDVECHDIKRRNQYIEGKHKNQIAGLEKILMLGKEYNIPINFFFDIVEGMRYGDDYSREIVQLIKSYNQPVFLHLHPHYVSGDNKREFFWQYSHDEKLDILKKGFDYYKKIVGEDSEFFRIGCYGADADMYHAMDELEIRTIDLSYCYNNPKMCHLECFHEKTRNKIVSYANQVIFPNTRYVSFKSGNIVKCNNVDASESTLNEWKRYLDNTKLDKITCTMHSWNFIKKYFFSPTYVRLNKQDESKFIKMIKIAQSKGFEFSRLKKSDFIENSSSDELQDMCEGLSGKTQMLFNNYFRFRKIGRLNKKYFIFFTGFESALLAIVVLIVFNILR